MADEDPLEHYWALPAGQVAASIGAGTGGLSQAEAAERLLRHGPNSMEEDEGVKRRYQRFFT